MKPELARRIAFTLGALLIFRLGSHIPVTGVSTPGGLLSPGVIGRISIFSLNLVPYLTAAIIIQLVSMVWRRLSALERSGEAGRRRIARRTLILALLLAAFQAFGVASAIQKFPELVTEPGSWFLLSATASMVGGVVFLVWLSEQITRHGIGNGLALIFLTGVVAELPNGLVSLLEYGRRGILSTGQIMLLMIFSVALVALIVFVERARRRIPVQFAARHLGGHVIPAQSTYLSLKLNSGGFLPTVVAPWLYLLPLSVAGIFFGQPPWLAAISGQLTFGESGHMILGSVAIILVAFLYTAFLVDPDHVAESLKKYGGVIPGIFPGEPTAEHVDRVVSRTTCVGAAYLVAVFLIPEILVGYYHSPFYLGGSSALIMVCTFLDIETQVRGPIAHRAGGRNV
jgi:preprotein translocase subunit SecY